MPLFCVAIIEQPKKKKDSERLVLEPTWVLAGDEAAAGLKAVREEAAEEEFDYDRIEVLVRPF